jgi:hypothetical protein
VIQRLRSEDRCEAPMGAAIIPSNAVPERDTHGRVAACSA